MEHIDIAECLRRVVVKAFQNLRCCVHLDTKGPMVVVRRLAEVVKAFVAAEADIDELETRLFEHLKGLKDEVDREFFTTFQLKVPPSQAALLVPALNTAPSSQWVWMMAMHCNPEPIVVYGSCSLARCGVFERLRMQRQEGQALNCLNCPTCKAGTLVSTVRHGINSKSGSLTYKANTPGLPKSGYTRDKACTSILLTKSCLEYACLKTRFGQESVLKISFTFERGLHSSEGCTRARLASASFTRK